MARLAAIVLILGVCQKENVLAREVLGAGEIDSSTVEIGAYVVVIYGQGERDPASGRWERMATAKGYVKTVDSDRLIIGDGSWKTEIARGRILKLISGMSTREMTSDTLSLRARYGPELTFEAGYFWGVSKAYTGYFIFGERKKRHCLGPHLSFSAISSQANDVRDLG